ncbi:MAG: YbaK/EbsC family protein [Pseudomonadales bacterium]|nr:YbaK/EbsC family protein [Pseudomonadales bacterium]
MAIAINLRTYMSNQGLSYESVHHQLTDTAFNTASAAHVESAQLAKAVMLQNEEQGTQLMVAVPANKHLSIAAVNQLTDSNYHLMAEVELAQIFSGCKPGAIPGCGDAFGVEMMVDDELLQADHVYLEAGDHQTLLKLDRENYAELVGCSRHGDFTAGMVGLQKMTEHFYAI